MRSLLPLPLAPRCCGSVVSRAGAKGQRGVVAVGIVLALLASAAVALAAQALQRALDAREREVVTLQRMERIRIALCAYHRLSSSATPLTDALGPPPVNLPLNRIRPLGWVNPGDVPSASLRQLGLSVEDVTDGWGRLIAVRTTGACTGSSPTIEVDTDGDGVSDLPPGQKACVVLVSHGRTGRGAAMPQALAPDQLSWVQPLPGPGASPAQGEGAEWRNSRSDSGAVGQPYQAVAPRCSTDNTNPDSSCHFDDVVRWYGAAGLHALCP